ncbi:lymphocyte antigen 6 complex locus protein G6d-like [Seriola dumerili]|uniref:lymphocyte antigen 6 complex locus protein G6d-like n=1 Tax=Seriola dumerili TaxID=41447 RepID=UPI000BBE4F36|nr:lymphocyte antigen 6 complex locus protein G6d-like [Seriola dumerili]
MAMVVTGESLTCNTCRVGIAGKCLFSSTETCSDSQSSCYWGNLAFNVSSLISLQTRGCLASSLCNQTEMGSLLTAGYTVNRTCCSTDCCNGAASIQFSLTAAVGAALLAVWSNLSL